MINKIELQKYSVDLLAECFGTFILILLNEGAIANYKFSGFTTHSTLSIYLAIGVGVYTALMIAGSITGAHINPAVTISLTTIGKIKPFQCIFYLVGQIFGAFFGAALVYLVYWSQFNRFDGGERQISGPNGTADIFFTRPGKDIPHWNAFIDQIVSTAILLIFILAISHNLNRMISERNKPFALILIVMGLNCAFSINADAALNPARDLGPRLFGGFIYGWTNVFKANNYYFWIPIFGPILGGIIGVGIYQSYSSIIDNYGHLSPIDDQQRHSLENNPQIIQTDDERSELTQRLTTTH